METLSKARIEVRARTEGTQSTSVTGADRSPGFLGFAAGGFRGPAVSWDQFVGERTSGFLEGRSGLMGQAGQKKHGQEGRHEGLPGRQKRLAPPGQRWLYPEMAMAPESTNSRGGRNLLSHAAA